MNFDLESKKKLKAGCRFGLPGHSSIIIIIIIIIIILKYPR